MEKLDTKQGFLSELDLENVIKKGLAQKDFTGQKLLVIIPDATRTCPTSLIFKTLCDELNPIVASLDFLIALGTHPPLNDRQIEDLVGMPKQEVAIKYNSVSIYNHNWQKNLVKIGEIDRETVQNISRGFLQEKIPVTINQRVLEAEQIITVGPVFPHEMVGFSGGYKYLFPGVSGPEIINVFHWLAALITNLKIIGYRDTPPRALINQAASLVKTPLTSISLVVDGQKTCGIFVGEIGQAWSSAVELSKERNIIFKEQKFKKVIAVMPKLYNELWTAGKGMYKLEPIVEDGGELIIYGPHIDRISDTHGAKIKKIGYHTKDYFLANYEQLREIPDAVKAHCAHVKGIGKYENSQEYPRIKVKLATKIPKSVCSKINLAYVNYDDIDLKSLADREEEGILVVKNAGEKLYRRKSEIKRNNDK